MIDLKKDIENDNIEPKEAAEKLGEDGRFDLRLIQLKKKASA